MSMGLQYQSSFYKPKTYKDMEETLFKLTRAITDTGTDTVSSKGGTVTYRITSLKRKLVNGKVVSTSTPSCTLGSTSVSWATWGGVTVGDGYLDVKINYSENTGSSRSTTLTFTQVGSDNKINLTVTQEAGVTYTSVIEIPQFYTISLANKAGASTTFEFTSYLLGSDGSKVAEKPSVSSLSSWLEVTSVEKGSSEHSYVVTFTANSSHSSNLLRVGEAVIHCGTASKNINVSQLPQLKPIVKQFTLTGLPLNKSCYLFASGSRPQSGGSGSTSGYSMIHGLDGQVTMNIPVKVNLSSYGNTTEADTGDKVTVWTSSGSLFSQIGSFTVPSAGGTVSI